MKDILGQNIKVGSRIAYPQRHGSWLAMVVGTVTKVSPGRLNVNVTHENSGWGPTDTKDRNTSISGKRVVLL